MMIKQGWVDKTFFQSTMDITICTLTVHGGPITIDGKATEDQIPVVVADAREFMLVPRTTPLDTSKPWVPPPNVKGKEA
jgi:hypothetical protein